MFKSPITKFLLKLIFACLCIISLSLNIAFAKKATPSSLIPKAVAVLNVDLAVTIAQPAPGLIQTALSEIPITITNRGGQIAKAPTTLVMPVPSGVETPLKFARNADAWVCLNKNNTLTCHYNKPIKAHDSTTLRMPVVPANRTLGKTLGPFVAIVAATTGEKNTQNNQASLKPSAAVKALNLASKRKFDETYDKALLDPTKIPKYALPLPNALNPNFQFKPDTSTIPGTELYKLHIDRIKTYILPPGFPGTTVFAYGDCDDCPENFSYPAHTIIANSTAPTFNKFGRGKFTKIQFKDDRHPEWPHLLPVDHSIHGAMDGEPDIRSVVHLHGFKQVKEDSDGYPESWKSPSGKTGDLFSRSATTTVPHNPNPFDQANNQEASLLWFHDHTLGITRLNVYAGLAGLYVLRDSNEQTLINNHSLPNGPYEIPLVLQDRMFHLDGSLAYPNRNPDAPKAPKDTMLPEFFGDVMMVNGVAWPYLDVEPRRYRFRLLNGSNARFYTLRLSNRGSFQILGSEGGFLKSPVAVKSLTIGPGERYDLVIDFSKMRGQTIVLKNLAKIPFGNAEGKAPTKKDLMDEIMVFRVNQALSKIPNKPLPKNLRITAIPSLKPSLTRQVLLAESEDESGRVLPILGTAKEGIKSWMEPGTERPKSWSVETWEIYNSTGDAHPIHLHGGHFQVINRQFYSAQQDKKTNALSQIKMTGAAKPAEHYEKTWKDTVITYPGEVTRIQVKFENPGLFVWHCHILEHEDHDMMRPLLVQ